MHSALAATLSLALLLAWPCPGAGFDTTNNHAKTSAELDAGPVPAILFNLSSRARVNTSDNLDAILIGGFIIEAPPGVTKRVLIRAIGPSLGEYGVSGALADTVLAVYDHGTSIASNDNWRDAQESEIEAAPPCWYEELDPVGLLSALPQRSKIPPWNCTTPAGICS